jgi:hypothetical protein
VYGSYDPTYQVNESGKTLELTDKKSRAQLPGISEFGRVIKVLGASFPRSFVD